MPTVTSFSKSNMFDNMKIGSIKIEHVYQSQLQDYGRLKMPIYQSQLQDYGTLKMLHRQSFIQLLTCFQHISGVQSGYVLQSFQVAWFVEKFCLSSEQATAREYII